MKKTILKNIISFNQSKKILYRTNVIITDKIITDIKTCFDKYYDVDDIFPGDNYIVIHGMLIFHEIQLNNGIKIQIYFNKNKNILIHNHRKTHEKTVIKILTTDIFRKIEKNIPANLFFFNHSNLNTNTQYSHSHLIDFINNTSPEKLMINGIIFNVKNNQGLQGVG
ncbi:hypothetical protein L4B25_15405 [Salmonella enterica subsp. diarizonae serovar 16:z10:e,n,x,z15]|uniref:hypothetical protein n=1 Tax=Salmonella enterica TaxID=28901 RepID=UPI0012D67592|nr:hypothetical protein [Salmonella enterica subsp. enterica]EDU6369119.1 hypothetical protein [Salmonella enterica subsp. houtenae serovar 40:z4,z24:-]EIX3163971.1 hypothetical protein [Salmonella enterica]MCH5493760.1 hypothetical protein [Salmonella enterica subsp. diarizonae serovar 16:z10:e,n,x,z15]EKN8573722.1 hypothetical protein [Salmonella enterica]